jgi:hypothetical protein
MYVCTKKSLEILGEVKVEKIKKNRSNIIGWKIKSNKLFGVCLLKCRS